MTTPPAHPYHAFARLELVVEEQSTPGVVTEHAFELRSITGGAEVWRSSVLTAGDSSCHSEERFVGTLTSRQVIDLLEQIEMSGVYEALPAAGIVDGQATQEYAECVSMRLVSETRERSLLDRAPAAHAIVGTVVRAVRRSVDLAAERSLTASG